MKRVSRRAVACLFLSLIAQPLVAQTNASPPAAATSYPDRAVVLVVPYSAGGGSDLVGRLLAEHLRETMGQPVAVENLAGGGGTIGYASVARARPDGYRLVITDSSQTTMPALYPKLSFDPVDGLDPVTLFFEVPVGVVVSSSVKAKNLAELIQIAKSSPGTLNFGSSGSGTAIHMAGEIFKKVAGVDIVHVPYKGGSAAMAALLGGQVELMFATLSTPGLSEHHRRGTLRVLAVSGNQRSALLPDVPSAAEEGFPDFRYAVWYGLSAPKGTPSEVLAKLHRETASFLGASTTRQKIQELGARPLGTAMADTRERIARETRDQSALVRQLGLATE